jgi:hypothetical protein
MFIYRVGTDETPVRSCVCSAPVRCAATANLSQNVEKAGKVVLSGLAAAALTASVRAEARPVRGIRGLGL